MPPNVVVPKNVERYGMLWPIEMPEFQADLILWQRHREAPYVGNAKFLNPISEHFLRACRAMFTPAQLVVHSWFEECAEAYTMYDGIALWGAAAVGKSHFIGIATLLDYITDPQNLYACLVSTSKEMLMLRSMASVVEGLQHLKSNGFDVPFKFVANKYSVVPITMSDDLSSCKTMIKGVAIQEGTEDDARAAIAGIHVPRVRSVLDEASAMKGRAKVFISAQANLAATADHKMALLFNPQSIYDPGCSAAVPVGGWGSIDQDTKSWVTTSGMKVLRFSAYDSPGRKDPKKYPFLPNDATIAKIIAQCNGNDDAPEVWTYLKAWPPPQSADRTVLTEAMIRAYAMHDRVVWRSIPVKLAALDPAFTADGDDAVLAIAELGYTVDGQLVLCFGTPRYLEIKASDQAPVLQQLVDQTCQILQSENIPLENFGVDDSGTQSVADAIVMRMGHGLYRCSFASKPPDLPVSVANSTLASKRYKDTVTWLYYTVSEFAQRGQIKGLPTEAARQFCLRHVLPKAIPLQLESKKLMKKRLNGRSPDEADACAILVGLARERLGLIPGATEWAPGGTLPPSWYRANEGPMIDVQQASNMDLDDGRYLHPST